MFRSLCFICLVLSICISVFRLNWFLNIFWRWPVTFQDLIYKLLDFSFFDVFHSITDIYVFWCSYCPVFGRWDPRQLAPESFSYSPIVFDNFLTHLVMFLRNREIIGIKISLILFGIFIWRDWAKVYPLLFLKRKLVVCARLYDEIVPQKKQFVLLKLFGRFNLLFYNWQLQSNAAFSITKSSHQRLWRGKCRWMSVTRDKEQQNERNPKPKCGLSVCRLRVPLT